MIRGTLDADGAGQDWLTKARGERGAPVRRPATTEAARLLGASERLLQATGAPLHRDVPGADWHERAISMARATLGPLAFEQARAAGRALSLEEAVNEALATVAARPPATEQP